MTLKKDTRTLKEIQAAKDLVKSYTVKYKEEGKKRVRTAKFSSLIDARSFGVDQYRLGTFVSLENIKGVLLPLGNTKKQEVTPVSY